MPDGTGLPPGSGTPPRARAIFAQKCAACHGEKGKGGISAALVGGGPITSINGGQKTIANFWPYATTLFDIIRRAMPWQQPRSLTNDEVYALTAYILALNKLIGENDAMNAKTLPKVRMPNRDGFIVRFPGQDVAGPLGHYRQEDVRRENDEVNDALQHRRAAGCDRQDADSQR